jgi:hypothetical protein
VLPEQREAWAYFEAARPALCHGIHLLTWRDVSIALRRALRSGERESVRWRVWAHAFVGAIEQEWLGLTTGSDVERWCQAMRLPAVHAATDLLSNGRPRSGT